MKMIYSKCTVYRKLNLIRNVDDSRIADFTLLVFFFRFVDNVVTSQIGEE